MHLAPVLLLMLAFPLASGRMAADRIGDTNLGAIVLASSVTVPWLSQVVCMPLYRGLGSLTVDGSCEQVRQRFSEVWPSTFARTLPAVLPFAALVEIVMRWSPAALLTYLALCTLHTAFAQSLVPGNALRQRRLWAAAWGVYAVALVTVPTWWFLPPVLAVATQLVPLRRHLLTPAGDLAHLGRKELTADLVRGFLLGAVLWCDKLFLFLALKGHFAVTVVFVALLPAVLAYSYYFVGFAPRLDGAISGFREAMSAEPHSRLAARSRALHGGIAGAIARTGALGAGLCLATTVSLGFASADALDMGAAVSLASWLFMMSTLACYKLDYIGSRSVAQAVSAVFLVLTAAVFLMSLGVVATYALLALIGAPLFLVALFLCRAQWLAPEYTMFWRHATAW